MMTDKKNLLLLFVLIASISYGSEISSDEAEYTRHVQSLCIKGIVEPCAELRVNPVSFISSRYSLRTEITELSNLSGGYKVKLVSVNAASNSLNTPVFISSVGKYDNLEYTITYGDKTVGFDSGLPAEITDCCGRQPGGSVTKILSIDYDKVKNPFNEVVYSDTLVFIIEAK